MKVWITKYALSRGLLEVDCGIGLPQNGCFSEKQEYGTV